MILLFNLNSYLGGGEVLLVRMAKELKSRGVDCGVLCSAGSYIEKETSTMGIYYKTWPIANDSLVYMSKNDKNKVRKFMSDTFETCKDLTVFTFCMRDTYNAAEFFRTVQGGHVKLCMGIFHPDETKYISKLSFHKNKIIESNRAVLREYHAADSIAFMNDRNLESCLPGADVMEYKIIPLPIPLDKSDDCRGKKSIADKEIYHVIWIGRFVDFKFTGIMNIIKFMEKNPKFYLTMVGYGPYEQKMRKYIEKHNIRNVELRGQIKPEEIKEVVSEMDLGYATGTSILEIAQYGVPTVISPMLGAKYCKKYENRCVGIFGATGNYNVGEVTSRDYGTLLKLDETMYDVVKNYEQYEDRGEQFIREFELGRVVSAYQELFKECKLEACDVRSIPPTPGLAKRIYKALYYKIKEGK